MAKHLIKIFIDEEKKLIEVSHTKNQYELTEETQRFLLESFTCFGGNAATKELFIKMFGASADAAWAYGQGFVIAQSPEGGEGLKNFYKQCAAHVCNAIDPTGFRHEVGAEEVLNRWDCQDQTKWAVEDTEDVLVDKQESEERKARLKKGLDLAAAADAPATKDKAKWN